MRVVGGVGGMGGVGGVGGCGSEKERMGEILLVIVHTGKKGGRRCREREREGEKVGKEGVILHVPFLTICHLYEGIIHWERRGYTPCTIPYNTSSLRLVMLLSCVVYYCIVTMIGALKTVSAVARRQMVRAWC